MDTNKYNHAERYGKHTIQSMQYSKKPEFYDTFKNEYRKIPVISPGPI